MHLSFDCDYVVFWAKIRPKPGPKTPVPKNWKIDDPTPKQKNIMEGDIFEENRVHRRVQRDHFTPRSIYLDSPLPISNRY